MKPLIKKFNIFFLLMAAVLAAMAVAGCVSTMPALPGAEVLAKGEQAQVTVAAQVLLAKALPDHERLVYRLTWLGIPAGEFIAEIKGRVQWRGRTCYLIEVTGRTIGFVSSLYRVDDHYRSYLDVEKLYTLRYEEYRREGGYYKDAVTDFDHAAGKAYFKNAADHTQKTFDIPSGVQDSLTSAYYARLLPLAPGKVYSFKVCNSEKVYDLYLSIPASSRVDGRQALHLVPFAKINGSDFREGRASGYVTDDDKKIPFLVVIKAPIFTSVTATLVE